MPLSNSQHTSCSRVPNICGLTIIKKPKFMGGDRRVSHKLLLYMVVSASCKLKKNNLELTIQKHLQ